MSQFRPTVTGQIHWVVTGTETGPRARPLDEYWVRVLRNACIASDVPFSYKQNTIEGRRLNKPMLDGRRRDESPALPIVTDIMGQHKSRVRLEASRSHCSHRCLAELKVIKEIPMCGRITLHKSDRGTPPCSGVTCHAKTHYTLFAMEYS